ncbi:MAG: nitrous oxide reductase accessory protein NosL [Gemmobacter sp.]
MIRTIAILFLLLAAACKEDVADRPPPVPLTASAVGHYCQMDLLEHPGPKAQVHLDGMPHPLFFSQVRDALAYQRLPEQSHIIVAIYVNDMGAAPSWEDPGAENWIDAETAVYVVGSSATGGMGVSEFVPFADRAAAAAFVARHGGQALAMAEIPVAAILAPEGGPPSAAADEGDFLRRLDALRHNSGG